MNVPTGRESGRPAISFGRDKDADRRKTGTADTPSKIPRDLELAGSRAVLCKEGNRLIVKPMARLSLLQVLSTWPPLEKEFPEIEDLQTIEDVDL
jgi:virulence-associated protein VagC